MEFLSHATDGAANKAGETVFEAIKSKCLSDRSRTEALEDFAREPGDEDLAAALRVQLKKLLQSDEQFAKRIRSCRAPRAPAPRSTPLRKPQGRT